MKRCPVCGAEYDDHVEYCFVDGAELTPGAPGPASSGPTPLPPPPSSASPSRRVLPVVLVLGGLAVILMLAVIAIAVLSMMGETEVLQPEDTDQVVEGTPDMGPTPRGAMVVVNSDPPGAEVWEGSTLLCARTPCRVEHPDHAPIPRKFEVRLRGFESATVTMTSADRPWSVELQPEANARPVPSPRPRPRPSSRPDVPSGDILDER